MSFKFSVKYFLLNKCLSFEYEKKNIFLNYFYPFSRTLSQGIALKFDLFIKNIGEYTKLYCIVYALRYLIKISTMFQLK